MLKSKGQPGHYLLYLLSKKKTLRWHDFKKYVEILYGRDSLEKDKYFILNLSRKLSALGYIDIGENNSQTYIKVTPPMLVALPYLTPIFLLTGACIPELLKTIKSHFQTEITSHKCLPATVMIKPENREDLEDHLQKVAFQGNKLSGYIKACEHPIAWDILEFTGDINQYEQSLSLEWHSGNTSDIKQFFDTSTLKFQNLESKEQFRNDLSLVKISHYEKSHTYYLFKSSNEDKAKVNLDWGRFIMAKQSNCPVLEYDKQTFELCSKLRFPAIFERGLTLLSGIPPIRENKKFIFKSVPYKIAELIACKLEQKLRFQNRKNNA